MQQKKLRQSYAELQNVVEYLKQELVNFGNSFRGNSEYLAAVISVLGEDVVTQEVVRLRKERRDAQEAQQVAGVKTLTEAGALEAIEASEPESLLVGTDSFPGSNRPPQRAQFEVLDLPEQDRPKYIGLKVGAEVEGNGAKFTLSEIYKVNKEKAIAFQKEQQKKFAEAIAAQQVAEGKAVEVKPAAPEEPAKQEIELEDDDI